MDGLSNSKYSIYALIKIIWSTLIEDKKNGIFWRTNCMVFIYTSRFQIEKRVKELAKDDLLTKISCCGCSHHLELAIEQVNLFVY